ncbi:MULTISPECIES: heme ABC transporter permease CcmC [Marinobacter]|jgi:heme exporter protein C|uniref:Heme exporter protein C n=1 Tax=Marinobacter adhaerens TaxID=1033846 RepID=A0A1E3CB12_9GAMM|nr:MULTISPECIES: heme ABC transporter permease CcmC [Marinobacter]MBO6811111.1 cytochrome c biogenesis protein CcsA [Marinobacter sp.]MBO6874618.1 cytochrome c biogenesis protein CcsA [Marinobacter sp.]MBY6070677.1 heme ABC transporter permease CcmC [Marinobacter salsuginis]MTI97059.1 heme ABC transporter permease [Marinobacter adhaerens]ODM32005.1 heme ABC transporter permease [Marinobacter adhaerens]|tara:strand:- start:1121 stop:1864 length:744 start_codon:yes stop_codon:yes gene_type:complete
MWQFFHKLGSPKWFFGIATRLMPWLLAGGILLLMAGIVWGLAFAPKDYLQGNSYRIIFIHVPTAFLAQSVYVMMAVAAVVTLVWRMKLADVFVKSVAPVGLVLTFLSLFTGAVWGKPTWGTWWVWDARLTSMLILLFLYGGVIALDRAINDEKSAARAVAVLVLVGVVNIPIIQYSVEWWNTLHQPSTFKLTEKPSMPAEMWVPLLLSVLGLYLLFGWLACLRMQTEILLREQRTRWVKDYVLAGRG